MCNAAVRLSMSARFVVPVVGFGARFDRRFAGADVHVLEEVAD